MRYILFFILSLSSCQKEPETKCEGMENLELVGGELKEKAEKDPLLGEKLQEGCKVQ